MRRKQILLKIARLTNAIEALEQDGQVKDRSQKESEALALLNEDRLQLLEELKLQVAGKETEKK